jgi:hypothetical protein
MHAGRQHPEAANTSFCQVITPAQLNDPRRAQMMLKFLF